MLRVAGKTASKEGVINNQLLSNRVQSFNCKNASRRHTLAPFVKACAVSVIGNFSSLKSQMPKMANQKRDKVEICATRRGRMGYSRSETYVLLEPGEEEKFVSEEELKVKLKYWLENWPGEALPPDLARFATIDDAVCFLISSVCELQLEGDTGSIQWYEVRLE